MNWSRIIGNIGRTLIGSGVLILLFVVYQLWGTALQERRAQNSLRSEFEELLETSASASSPLSELETAELPARLEPAAFIAASDSPSDADSAVTPDGEPAEGEAAADEARPRAALGLVDPSELLIDPTATTFGPPPPPPEGGDAIAQLRIPAIGLEKVVVHGVGTNALKKGPGHYPGTPLPGQPGNAAIAGHRTTYGAPFYDLDELQEHDLIYVTTAQGSFQYRVVESFVVKPDDVWVIDPSDDDRLTLTTCNPRYSARERLVVVALLIGPTAPLDPFAKVERPEELPGEDELPSESDEAVPEDVDDSTVAAPPTTVSPAVAEEAPPIDDLVSHLDGDRAESWPAIFWGALAAFVWILTWYAGRYWRRWTSYAIGGPVFLLVLFVFFENFSRLLPPGV